MPQQYRWLMEGLKVEQPKAHRRGMTCIYFSPKNIWNHWKFNFGFKYSMINP